MELCIKQLCTLCNLRNVNSPCREFLKLVNGINRNHIIAKYSKLILYEYWQLCVKKGAFTSLFYITEGSKKSYYAAAAISVVTKLQKLFMASMYISQTRRQNAKWKRITGRHGKLTAPFFISVELFPLGLRSRKCNHRSRYWPTNTNPSKSFSLQTSDNKACNRNV